MTVTVEKGRLVIYSRFHHGVRSTEDRFHLLAIKWELSEEDLERLRLLVKWRVERSTASYDDYLSSLERSSDLRAVLTWMAIRKDEAEAERGDFVDRR